MGKELGVPRARVARHAQGGEGRRSLASVVTATTLCGLTVVLLAAGILLEVLTHNLHYGANAFLALGFAAVGYLVALRQSHNPIGWLLLVTALVVTLGNDAKLYSVLDYRLHHGSLPLGLVAVFVAGGWSAVGLLVAAPTLLLFPEGRLPSRQWRWVSWTYLALSFLLVAGQIIAEVGVLGQPISIDALGNANNNPTGVLSDFQASFLLIFALIPTWVSWAVYQVRNYRRST